MPIYAYKCSSCGYAKDVLQKMSDAPLTVCPECGAAAFSKQLTAAGFQLKGSGWYVTDFRGGSQGASKADGDSKSEGADKAAGSDASTAAPASAPAPAAAPASAPAAAPAPAASGSSSSGSSTKN